MNKDFDLNKTGKHNPYTTPDAFFETLEENIWEEVKGDYMRPKSSHLRMVMGSVAALAASVALVFFVQMKLNRQSPYTINDVDQAFSQLSTDDQTFLFSVYQNDLFISSE